MKINLLLVLILVTFAVSPRTVFVQSQDALPAATKDAPPRTLKNRVLVSPTMPAVRIKFGGPFKYAGAQSFILYDVAHAEQHFFVDADKQGRIKRLYWIQFEGYLPNNTHNSFLQASGMWHSQVSET